MNVSKRAPFVAIAVCVAVIAIVVVKTMGQDEASRSDRNIVEQWEYLAVAGPSTSNLTATGNPRMRKEPNVPFGREAFVLEQHLDKLGANGWELIAVAGPPTDPAYYFKRRKQTESSR
ncbi:MAG TPA: hypothetical protein VE980_04415 [Pyrinomonadaceae bacterium]|nr:hypothetical protein [Pyrinomonadaceae bacterium]